MTALPEAVREAVARSLAARRAIWVWGDAFGEHMGLACAGKHPDYLIMVCGADVVPLVEEVE